MRSSLFVLLLALAASSTAWAQNSNNYGSIYSRFGLGEREDFSSSQANALGGLGVALRSPQYNGLANPALWADLAFTDFAASAVVRSVSTTDGSDATSQGGSGGLGALELGLPLLRERLGLTIAFRPYSRVNYRAIQEGTFTPDTGGEEVDFTTNFEGGGGLYQISAGLGAKLTNGLRIGASVDSYFGNVSYLQRTTFLDEGYEETRATRTARLSGISGTVGVVFTAPSVFNEGDGFHIGGAVTLPAQLSGEEVRTLGFSLDQDTLSVAENGDVTLPLVARAGIAFTGRERWTLAADVLYEPWSKFESTFAFGGFDPDTGVNALRDRFRVSGGFQVVPGGRDRTAGFLARSAYRLGAYTERAFYAPTGTGVQTLAVTGGLSFPTLIPTARLDLGIEAGVRGATDGILVRDTFIRGTATINFGERWFVRRRFG
jgi:hypothetical protein